MTPTPTGGVAIGVDVGGTNVRAARVSATGTATDHVRLRTDTTQDVSRLIADVCRGLLDEDVEAIGVGVPGRISRDGETVLSAGFVELADIPLAPMLREATGLPVFIENDAHMALHAELECGAAVDASDVVLFTVGTGIGGAVAMGRRIQRGRANAGQLGHLAIDPEGPTCRCGRRGCSETLTSGTALARLVAEAGLTGDVTAEKLMERAPSDPVAADVLRRWAGAWRDSIDTTIAVVDPDLVVLGGGLGSAAAAALATFAPHGSPWFECPVQPALLGDDAGVVGAGLRAFAR